MAYGSLARTDEIPVHEMETVQVIKGILGLQIMARVSDRSAADRGREPDKLTHIHDILVDDKGRALGLALGSFPDLSDRAIPAGRGASAPCSRPFALSACMYALSKEVVNVLASGFVVQVLDEEDAVDIARDADRRHPRSVGALAAGFAGYTGSSCQFAGVSVAVRGCKRARRPGRRSTWN